VGCYLIGENGADEVGVIDLAAAGVDRLEQLIDLLVAHLLAKVCEDVSQLSHANEARHILVKDLEAAAIFFWLAGVAEPAWAVKDFLKGIEVEITTDTLLQISDFRQRRILAACAEEVTQLLERDASVAALVEKGERFFVVC